MAQRLQIARIGAKEATMLWKHEAEVLVVGAGPAGMMTALMLAEQGVRVEVIDQEGGGGRHNYALVLQGSVLELLDGVGLTPRLLGRGAAVDRMIVHEGVEQHTESALAPGRTDLPPLLVLPCTALEEVLEQRLHELKVPIHYNQRCAGVAEGAHGVSVTIETLTVESGGYPIGGHVFAVDKIKERVFAYVVGADGAGSLVRRRSDIGAAPLGQPESFVAIELASTVDLGRKAHVVLEGGTTNVLWPLPGGRCRWTLQTDGDNGAETIAPPSMSQIHRLVHARAPWFDTGSGEVGWAALLRFRPEVAERLGRGRVWLVGDAAHVTGAVGVPGLNEGLREAHDLAGRMARVLRGTADADLLEQYADARGAAWRQASWSSGGPALVGYLTGREASAGATELRAP
jgi:2-polyprenyl-6-methoxyphenol hydroxylase-like FAD-dependent oxidoreductase